MSEYQYIDRRFSRVNAQAARNSLELIDSFRVSIQLQLDLNTSEDQFFAALEIHTKLYDVTIVALVRSALRIGRAKSNTIQEGPTRASYILHPPRTAIPHKLTMPPGDYF